VNRTVLAVQRRINGAEHPDTLMTASNLAVALERQRKYAEAEAMYREVLAIRRRVLGPEHADTLTTASNLAPALSGQRKFVEAETLLRELLVIQQRVLGRAHPDTMIATVNLSGQARRRSAFASWNACAAAAGAGTRTPRHGQCNEDLGTLPSRGPRQH